MCLALILSRWSHSRRVVSPRSPLPVGSSQLRSFARSQSRDERRSLRRALAAFVEDRALVAKRGCSSCRVPHAGRITDVIVLTSARHLERSTTSCFFPAGVSL